MNSGIQNEFIQHHGVLGMKWGVRRSKEQLKNSRIKNGKINKKNTKKKVSEMTDEELKKRVNRMSLEQQYNRLNSDSASNGKRYVQKAIKTGTTVASITGTALTLYNNIDKINSILKKK